MDDLALLNDETPIADAVAGEVALTDAVAATDGGDAPAVDPASEPATPPDAPVAVAIEVEYPDEEPAVDPPVTPAAAPPDAVAAANWGAEALEQWLAAHPDLQKSLALDPAAQAQLRAMAQRSDELNVFQKTFATPAAAQAAAEAAGQLASLEKVYASGEQPEQFWQALYDAALVEGKPSGAYERNVRFLHEAFLDQLGARGLGEAAQAIRSGLKWAPPAAPAAAAAPAPPLGADPSIPDHLRGRMAQADRDAAELRELRAGRERETAARNESFLNDTAADVASGLKDFVGGLLAGAKLSDYDKQNIARDFAEKVSELAAQDQAHSATLLELFKTGGANPATRQRMAAKAQSWARQNGRGILEPILQRAGAGLKQRQADRAARPARAEPAAGGTVSDPRPPSARELVRAAEQRHGKRLTDREILDLA